MGLKRKHLKRSSQDDLNNPPEKFLATTAASFAYIITGLVELLNAANRRHDYVVAKERLDKIINFQNLATIALNESRLVKQNVDSIMLFYLNNSYLEVTRDFSRLDHSNYSSFDLFLRDFAKHEQRDDSVKLSVCNSAANTTSARRAANTTSAPRAANTTSAPRDRKLIDKPPSIANKVDLTYNDDNDYDSNYMIAKLRDASEDFWIWADDIKS
jgi:hypothetical protein